MSSSSWSKKYSSKDPKPGQVQCSVVQDGAAKWLWCLWLKCSEMTDFNHSHCWFMETFESCEDKMKIINSEMSHKSNVSRREAENLKTLNRMRILGQGSREYEKPGFVILQKCGSSDGRLYVTSWVSVVSSFTDRSERPSCFSLHMVLPFLGPPLTMLG